MVNKNNIKQYAFALVEMQSVSRCGWLTAMSRKLRYYDSDAGCESYKFGQSKISKRRNNNKSHMAAFSLVEMLMALLVASLLMAALAPVMTRKIGENVNLTGNMNPAGTVRKTIEIEYNSADCNEIKIAADGSQYCEGEFEVPGGYNGMMKITAIGAGGGGAAAATAGYTEYTAIGETNTFNVPYGVSEIEATLVSGGSGGGAGGQDIQNVYFKEKDGKFSWTPADITLGKNVNVTGCGGGGGGGGQRGIGVGGYGGGGGSGAYGSIPIKVSNKNPWEIHIGGGGGGGGAYNCDAGKNGGYFAGGGGGGSGNAGINTHGYGGSAGSETGGAGGIACSSAIDGVSPLRNGVSAVPAGGGAGGAGTTITGDYRANLGAAGGAGGSIAGGGGGASIYGSSGGAGGGGATRLIINNSLAAIWPGGGGGGGRSGCNTNPGINHCFLGGGGGGGGGAGGGKGGDAVDVWYGEAITQKDGNPGLGGYTDLFRIKADGKIAYGGVINVNNYAFDTNCCHGGDSYNANSDVALGQNGKHGALKVSYLDYGVSGGGGGGGGIVPLRKVAVTSGDILKIKIGRGGTGGTAGYIKDDGTILEPAIGEDSAWNTNEPNCNVTKISKTNGEVLLTTSYSTNWAGPTSGSNGKTGNYGGAGAISDGKMTPSGGGGLVSVIGFANTQGNSAGKKTQGGEGGSVTTPFTGTCETGKGGTEVSPNGTNATGYGCGGGGGYSYFGNGGSGSNGYARISWNKYYDVAQKVYKLANTGAGGGGAGGNMFTYNINVRSNEILKFRIGKGGTGGNGSFASSSNDIDREKLNGTKGGDTVFAFNTDRQLIAGGGAGGSYPVIKSALGVNKFINGTGGDISNVCSYNGKSYFNNEKYCTKGNAGKDALDNTGGAGADFKPFTFKLIDSSGAEVEKWVAGTGGAGGIAGLTSYGGHSENSYGAGGGGAGLWDLGEVSSNGASNPSRGGNGSNGKIIIEWWE